MGAIPLLHETGGCYSLDMRFLGWSQKERRLAAVARSAKHSGKTDCFREGM